MSQWKFNNFETDVDFTDADFMEKFENAYEEMMQNINKTPKTGKVSEAIRAQIEVLDKFFTHVFGKDAIEKLFLGKASVELRIDACNSLYDFRNKENMRYNSIVNKYRPNRQQRRNQSKNKGKR